MQDDNILALNLQNGQIMTQFKRDQGEGSEPAYIKEIVQDVIEKLNSKSPSGSNDQLVGIDDQKKEIISLLCIPQEKPRIIGIWGMGGIGKTTLAQAIYDEVSIQFDDRYFLQNVREKLEKQGMESLRNELLSKVLKQEIQVDTPLIGSTLIQDRLQMKRVCVVLDDVNDYDQIEGLGVKHFGVGSKIILTSRDKQVLRIEVDGVDVIYEVKRLNCYYSLRLFSRFAFKQDQPVTDFRDLSGNFAEYAGGVPLALKVLGCALYQKPREYWKSTLDKLKEYPDQNFFNVLKISFDGLDDLEKNLFLDIAFFFQGENTEDVKKILNSCYKGASSGICNLVDKCLMDETLRMHDLLQEMGWYIVRQESNYPGRRSRLRNSKDVYHVLKNNKGTEYIEGISLNLSEIGVLQLCPNIFNKMVNLRIIKFCYPSYTKNVKEFKLLLSDQDLNSLPDELRYLHWEYCPLKFFPSSFCPENLVELKLTYYNIEQLWNGDQNIVNLRVMALEGCKNLTRISNLLRAINIRELRIMLCKSLVELPSLNHLTCLSYLCISECPITKFPDIPENLKFLRLSETQIGEVPSSIGCQNKLEYLDMSGTRIQNLPTSIVKLDAIYCIRLSDCPNFTNFPNVPEKIEELYLDCTAIEEVPSSISRLKNLRSLTMTDCKSLKSISKLPLRLPELNAQGCTSLKKVTSTEQYQFPFRANESWKSIMFADCFDLDPDAIDNIVVHTLLGSKSMAKQWAEELIDELSEIEYFRVECCLPGNEISERFENQSMNSSITAKLGSNRCGYVGRLLGFVLCLVVDSWVSNDDCIGVHCRYLLKTKCGDSHEYNIKINLWCPMNDDESMPLEYPKHMLIYFDSNMLCEDKQYEEAAFRFYFTDYLDENPLDDYKVEKCGVHVFYVDAKSSDDCNVKSSKRFSSAEEGVELALERLEPSSGSHLSLIQDDANSCDLDMIKPNSPVDPNWLSLKCGVNSSYVGVVNIENEHADLIEKDVNGNLSSSDDKDEPEEFISIAKDKGETSGVNNLKLKKQKQYCMDSFGKPGLPKGLKKMIKGIEGTDEKLIIQKPLTKTDLNKHHCRLAIPMNQVKVEFLTDEEKNELNEKKSKGIGTLVIEPSLETRKLIFKRWDMKKPSRKTCSIYVLSSDWNSVVKGNDLKVNDVIQLWSFRAKWILCFAMVIVRRVGEGR
ncbi:hypothetical protein CRYUN_Cryun01aG0106600 [Craigia yunnanensis]